ncbi:MAG TPA: glycosyltransferase [Candidatus Paceibacterota bacterium]|nr:glycosyltransferase [Candidatus Paceibacterota bacterium]
MKRVLIFSLAYYPKFVGGDSVAIREITDRTNPDELEFHMVTLRFDSTLPKVERVGNVLVHRIGFTRVNPNSADLKKFPLHYNKYLFQFTAAFKAASLHHRYKYDGIWAVMAHSAGVPAAIFKLFHSNVPYLLTLQEGDPPHYIERVMRPVWPLFKRAFTSADMVQAISVFLSDWARRMGYKGPLEIIPNGVDIRRFTGPQERFEVRKALNIRENETILITSSRLVRKNAVDDVIRAMALLPATVHFLVLGVGPDEAKLKQLAHDLGVAPRVKFLGHISHDKLPAYLQASTIFIRPSRSEGFGNSFVEAMAADLPVIATQEGGIADFLFDRKRNPDMPTTGWAVDKDSPEQIAAAAEDILSNPEQVKKVISTAHKLAVEKYDWEIVARAMRQRVFNLLLKH